MRVATGISVIALCSLAASVACSNRSSSKTPTTADSASALPSDSNAVANALPYALTFTPVTWNGKAPLPALQSYTWASYQGVWLVFGGRRNQGLHKFNQTGANFPVDSADTYLWIIDPENQAVDSFPVRTLPSKLWPLLASENQNFWYNRTTGVLYTAGGYGWKADSSNMQTFGDLISLNVADVIDSIGAHASPAGMASLFQATMDKRFAVTGGALLNVNGVFYLPFGQLFNGQYRAFGGGGGGSQFTQTYTNRIAQFTLSSGSGPPRVNSYDSLLTTDRSEPFHRRDGNFIDDINPATGKPRVAAYGGVFPPGVIGAYNTAVYVDLTGVTVDTTVHQRFNAYVAPVISVWDSTNKRVYHTFYGGISGYYYHFTHAQDSVYNLVTTEGRNDALPFIADVSTLVHDSAGNYQEWIATQPTTSDTLLVGASAAFIPNDQLIAKGVFTANGHVRLNALPANSRIMIGWIYGGIQAQNPLPIVPSTGTAATNLLEQVWITRGPTAAIPASKGHSATPAYPAFNHSHSG